MDEKLNWLIDQLKGELASIDEAKSSLGKTTIFGEVIDEAAMLDTVERCLKRAGEWAEAARRRAGGERQLSYEGKKIVQNWVYMTHKEGVTPSDIDEFFRQAEEHYAIRSKKEGGEGSWIAIPLEDVDDGVAESLREWATGATLEIGGEYFEE